MSILQSKKVLYLKKAIYFLLICFVLNIVSAYVAGYGIIGVIGLMVIPITMVALYKLFTEPRYGILISFFLAFIVNSIGRYVPGPFGLMLDSILLMTLLATAFSIKQSEWSRAGNILVMAVAIWFFYTILEIFNPEADSLEAWFYASRSLSFYMMVFIPLVFLIYNKESDFDTMMIIWGVGSIISTLYGMKQLYVGLNDAERYWLASGAAKQHILFGKLRVFSFYSDAGQFGAFMAFTAVVTGILAVKERRINYRIFYIITSAISAYGMAISGTRGALFVPMAGVCMYLFIGKNFKVLLLGSLILGGVFCVLKFTFIGQGNYQIQRMRSALNPDDPSFQARLENQRKFKEYLKSRPFGGGVGSAGFWGNRFSPGTFLAETPTDSHYVRVWAETGIVGLVIHLGSLIVMMVIGFMKIFKIKDVYRKQKLIACYAGCAGIIVASYGNQVMSQTPTSIFFYTCLSFIYIGSQWEAESQIKVASKQ